MTIDETKLNEFMGKIVGDLGRDDEQRAARSSATASASTRRWRRSGR